MFDVLSHTGWILGQTLGINQTVEFNFCCVKCHSHVIWIAWDTNVFYYIFCKKRKKREKISNISSENKTNIYSWPRTSNLLGTKEYLHVWYSKKKFLSKGCKSRSANYPYSRLKTKGCCISITNAWKNTYGKFQSKNKSLIRAIGIQRTNVEIGFYADIS